jgi:metal-dependent amidase/aminoacylase/carboxypeptidase family protein
MRSPAGTSRQWAWLRSIRKTLNPIVLNCGKIAGGTAINVIPEVVEMLGTLRSTRMRWRSGLQCTPWWRTGF